MRKNSWMVFLFAGFLFAGCSGAFWGGTGTGAAGAGSAYEIRAKQQLDSIKNDLNSGKIDQREYDIRKDQIRRMSLVY
jgi:hypothetical protein